jgi:hypothetical protein
LIDPGPTCHTLLSPFLSLIGGVHSRDGPTHRPPHSLFSLPHTGPLSPLRSLAPDVHTACSATPLPARCCPTALSLAQHRPALKPPPPSAILPRPSPSHHHSARPTSAATPSPHPTTDRGPQHLIIAVSSLPLSGTRLESRSVHASFTGKAWRHHLQPLPLCRLSSVSPHPMVPSQPPHPDTAVLVGEALLPSPFLYACHHHAELPGRATATACPSVPMSPHC